jgi:hypothetical protein
MQVDPVKPKLKPPGTKRLNLIYDEPLSHFAFKFHMRRHGKAATRERRHAARHLEAGDYTHSHFRLT